MDIFQSPDGRSISLDDVAITPSNYSSVTFRDNGIVFNFIKEDGQTLTCVARLEIREDRIPTIAGMLVGVAETLGLDWQSTRVFRMEPPPKH